ncbi:type II secretion system F family protein [Arthrobacter pascens]|uniref:type II secretion system F family protein n=1 Tax=Arthrobacter pascens TaxID=1677 RepID=UPI00196A3C45|nr:type II secretion system F family protein [Arthrobacter pascens]MBN3497183.1 type II secretion system F family protein [Arthrobacter pascens]MDR6559298.1 pilus assembly protein TadC [Arthrobacter pascens]
MTEPAVSAAVIASLLALAAALALSGRSRIRKRLLAKVGVLLDDTTSPGDAVRSGPASQNAGLRDPAMMLELVAAMLDAGCGIGRSLELVAAAASPSYRNSLRPVVAALAIGADWETAWRSSEGHSAEVVALRDALGFAALTGAPSSAILYAQAARMRRERFRSAEKRAASLSVKLVIPLGLCSLPAFICLGVVPVLLALVPSGS